MQFLNPAMLFGLVAAGIPILLHFLSRRRLQDVPFAPLRFLLTTQERQMRRMSLRRLLLLLIRVAIVMAIVMAMARPTLTGGLASLMRGSEGASAIILVDASASMQAQQSGGTLFDRAREQAREVASELGRNDELAVMLFHDGVEPLFGEFVRDPDVVISELAEARPSYRGTDYLNAIDGALDMLQRGSKPYREIYLISDLQSVEVDTMRLARLRARLTIERPTNVFLRAVEGEPFVNRQVVSVQRPPTLLRSGQTAEIAALVRQDGADELPVQLFLQLLESTIGETEFSLSGGGEHRHVFPVTLPDAGDLGGSVRLRPDRLTIDDERYFVLDVGEQMPVEILVGVAGLEGERDPLLFLEAALDPSGRGDGAFALSVESAEEFDIQILDQARVVIGSDVRGLGAARLAALTDYLESGGSLLLFVGDPRVREYTNEKLLPAWTDLVLGEFRGSSDVHERLEISAADHAIFAGFEADELETLREVQLRNFYRLPEDRGRPLMRFRDGGAAVLELEVGKGRVVLCGFNTAASAGDLPYSPMFLPLVQRLTGYLATAGWGRFGRQFAVGQTIGIAAPSDATVSDVFETLMPDGRRAPATLDATAVPPRVNFEDAWIPGLYAFERLGEPLGLVAVNVPGAESIAETRTPAQFRDAIGVSGNVSFRTLEGASAAEAVRHARQGVAIHRWFLILAALLLCVESLISRRVGPSPA